MSSTKDACEMPSDASSVEDFTNSGNLRLARLAKLPAERKQPERRSRYAMRREHALRQHLVARQHHAARVAARVTLSNHLEVRDDVVVVRNDSRELVEQVEHDVGPPCIDRLAQLRQMIADADDANLVSQPPQSLAHVVLGPKVVDFRFAQAADVVRRHERLVRHQQDPVPPHGARRHEPLIGRDVRSSSKRSEA